MNIYIWKENSLCFTAEQANSTVQLTKTGTPTAVSLETSTDGKTWSSYTIGDTITLSNVGDKVYFSNASTSTTGFSTSLSNYYKFVMTGSISGNGDITSLLNKNGTDTLSNYCFNKLFRDCSSLITPPELSSTTLADYCYLGMFLSCTGLITMPKLPATTLKSNCYNGMFALCSSLTSISELPATTLTTSCYLQMFKNCSALKDTPKLPATTLADNCYNEMFANCTLLEVLPKLPATTLTYQCYYYMFYGCSKIKLSSSQTGAYQTAYRIPTTGTGSVGTSSLGSMFLNTGGTFTGTPSINTTYYTSNTVV